MLVTLAQAISHLKLPIDEAATPPDPRLADLTLKLAAAEGIILDYLKTPHPEWTDETDTPPLVQAAILLELGELWRFRGDDIDSQAAPQTDGYLSPTITNLLRRLRDPAYA